MKNNVTIEDIKGIENHLEVQLTNEQRVIILNEFNRLVMDSADGWNKIIEDLIQKIC
jgi:hypothetical protein